MQPAEYYRCSKTWKKWLGKTGRVVASSVIRVTTPEFESSTPYSYVIADIQISPKKTERHGFVSVSGQEFEIGDHLICVLRRMGQVDDSSLIPYGIKVKKIGQKV